MKDAKEIAPLALRPREAAKALGVSERTLRTWVAQGRIPFVRINGTVLYPYHLLQQWLSLLAERVTDGQHQQ